MGEAVWPSLAVLLVVGGLLGSLAGLGFVILLTAKAYLTGNPRQTAQR